MSSALGSGHGSSRKTSNSNANNNNVADNFESLVFGSHSSGLNTSEKPNVKTSMTRSSPLEVDVTSFNKKTEPVKPQKEKYTKSKRYDSVPQSETAGNLLDIGPSTTAATPDFFNDILLSHSTVPQNNWGPSGGVSSNLLQLGNGPTVPAVRYDPFAELSVQPEPKLGVMAENQNFVTSSKNTKSKSNDLADLWSMVK